MKKILTNAQVIHASKEMGSVRMKSVILFANAKADMKEYIAKLKLMNANVMRHVLTELVTIGEVTGIVIAIMVLEERIVRLSLLDAKLINARMVGHVYHIWKMKRSISSIVPALLGFTERDVKK